MKTYEHISENALEDLPDRIVVSPAHGRFVVGHGDSTQGESVRAGDVLGSIEASQGTVEMRSPCDAEVLGFLARDGERVRPGAPIVHIREI